MQLNESVSSQSGVLKNLSMIFVELNQAQGTNKKLICSELIIEYFRADNVVFAQRQTDNAFSHTVYNREGKFLNQENEKSLLELESIIDTFGRSKATQLSPSRQHVSIALGYNMRGPIGFMGIVRMDSPFSEEETLALEAIAGFIGSNIIKEVENTILLSKQGEEGSDDPNSVKIIGKSSTLLKITQLARRIAKTTSSVLIEGPSGTGKELIAKLLHQESTRKEKTFVSINCGALQETLLESELFGHEKGSFTGAYKTKTGLAEVADAGTLFLDEVGEMSAAMQSKLLRFLQEGEIYRVGGNKPIKVDVRIIAATNRNLAHEVKIGKFREDLYYRLNVMYLKMPALKDRSQDIPLLVDFFLKMEGFKNYKVQQEVYGALMAYHWPGNIRELKNVIERMRIFAVDGVITMDHLPEHIAQQAQSASLVTQNPSTQNSETSMVQEALPTKKIQSLESVERAYILKALDIYKNNKTQTAKALKITVKTLYNKLHRYGMEHLIQNEAN